MVHWLSMYFLAWILSTALIIYVWSFQNFSLNIRSLTGATKLCKSFELKAGFIFLTASQAHFDFECPISVFLNKNCLLRLLVSILSLSVTIKFLPLAVDIPIKAKFFKNSHPKAPAPIMKILDSSIFFWISLPYIAIWSSYLLFFKVRSTLSPKLATVSKKSNKSHWLMGVYFPVYLTISWANTPPKKAHTGEISARLQAATWAGIFSSQSCTPENQLSLPSFASLEFWSYNSFVLLTISSTWDLLFNSGRDLFFE